MASVRRGWTNEQVDRIIGALLRVGITISACFVLVGGVLYMRRYRAASPDYRVFPGEPTDLRAVHGIIADSLSGHSRGVIQLDLLLIATPLGRVAFSAFAFALQRDPTYVIVTMTVFFIFIYSLMGGGL
jgi:uncharacterized membrane protein